MKLTAERARARIDQLTAPARELSMKEQDYLQALTLALDVLDAKPVASISERSLNELEGGLSVSAHAPGYGEHLLYLLEQKS